MNLPSEQAAEFARFPVALRELVEAELAAGNPIAELAHGFPAAPCGAWIRLERPVTTRPRENGPGLSFYDRRGSSYSGEFTDAQRHFFVLEPPHPPEPPPDMDAIRAALEAREQASRSRLSAAHDAPAQTVSWTDAERAIRERVPLNNSPAVARFKASMVIDYEKWHDGVGYDLAVLPAASVEDLRAIEELLIRRHPLDWRDVEALAAIGSDRARRALRDAARDPGVEVRLAVQRYASDVLDETERVDLLVEALERAEFYGGLTQALDWAVEFHPLRVERALWCGLLERDGSAAYHFAAALCQIHGRIASRHGTELRPQLLRFNTPDPVERRQRVEELAADLGVDLARMIPPRLRR